MKMNNDSLVSIVIPTSNSGKTIEICLKSIAAQTYPNIEVMVVDNFSNDRTVQIAKGFGAKIIGNRAGMSEARNIGTLHSRGRYILSLDSDMELTPRVIEQSVDKVREGYDALIIPEITVGVGFWAKCKALEKSCYVGDDLIESSRFFKREILEAVNGYDAELEAGEDWDINQRIKKSGYRVARINAFARHHEGHLNPWSVIKKKYHYGKTVEKYRIKHPHEARQQLRFVRPSLTRNWRRCAENPIQVFGMFFMKACEFGAGWLGLLEARMIHDKNQ